MRDGAAVDAPFALAELLVLDLPERPELVERLARVVASSGSNVCGTAIASNRLADHAVITIDMRRRVPIVEPAEVTGARDVDEQSRWASAASGSINANIDTDAVLVEVVVVTNRRRRRAGPRLDRGSGTPSRPTGRPAARRALVPGQCDSVNTVDRFAEPSTTTLGTSIVSPIRRVDERSHPLRMPGGWWRAAPRSAASSAGAPTRSPTDV